MMCSRLSVAISAALMTSSLAAPRVRGWRFHEPDFGRAPTVSKERRCASCGVGIVSGRRCFACSQRKR